MARRRRLRWVVGTAVVVLLAAAVAAGIAYRGHRPAITFLATLGSDDPFEADFRTVRVPSEAGNGVRDELHLASPMSGAPTIVLVAGVTPQGVRDPRVARLAWAFHRAGFAVLLPEIEELKRLGEGTGGVDAVRSALRFAAAGTSSDPARIGLVGVSLGGPFVLRAAIDAPAQLRAVLLVGVPDDTRALASTWFRRPVAAEASGREWARSEAGIFARHGMLEIALRNVVPAAEADPLRAWIESMGEDPVRRKDDDPRPASPAGRRWVAAAAAEDAIAEDDLRWVLSGASEALVRMSPAAWDADLSGLRAPCFLIHGLEDPLVPVTEMDGLAARLRRRVAVRTLASPMLSHVGVESPGLGETWRHVRFLTAFFDALEGR